MKHSKSWGGGGGVGGEGVPGPLGLTPSKPVLRRRQGWEPGGHPSPGNSGHPPPPTESPLHTRNTRWQTTTAVRLLFRFRDRKAVSKRQPGM